MNRWLTGAMCVAIAVTGRQVLKDDSRHVATAAETASRTEAAASPAPASPRQLPSRDAVPENIVLDDASFARSAAPSANVFSDEPAVPVIAPGDAADDTVALDVELTPAFERTGLVATTTTAEPRHIGPYLALETVNGIALSASAEQPVNLGVYLGSDIGNVPVQAAGTAEPVDIGEPLSLPLPGLQPGSQPESQR